MKKEEIEIKPDSYRVEIFQPTTLTCGHMKVTLIFNESFNVKEDLKFKLLVNKPENLNEFLQLNNIKESDLLKWLETNF